MGYHNHYNDVGFARGKISLRQTVERIRAMGEKVLTAAKEELKKETREHTLVLFLILVFSI